MSARVSPAQRNLVLAIGSRVLQYPDLDLLDQLPLLRSTASQLPTPVRDPLAVVLDHLARSALLELQAEYVETFDLRRRNCLYLSYFLNGDTRRRGAALWRFQDLYQRHGLAPVEGELADYLPTLMELVAELAPDDREPLDMLLEHLAGIQVLRHSLEDDGSPWAGAIVALERALPKPSAEVLAAAERIATQGPPAEQVGLDGYAAPGVGGGQA